MPMKIGDFSSKFNMVLTFDEIEIEELPDDFYGSIISELIEKHQLGSQWLSLGCQETGGIVIPNGGKNHGY